MASAGFGGSPGLVSLATKVDALLRELADIGEKGFLTYLEKAYLPSLVLSFPMLIGIRHVQNCPAIPACCSTAIPVS